VLIRGLRGKGNRGDINCKKNGGGGPLCRSSVLPHVKVVAKVKERSSKGGVTKGAVHAVVERTSPKRGGEGQPPPGWQQVENGGRRKKSGKNSKTVSTKKIVGLERKKIL